MGSSKYLDPAEITKLVSPFVEQATCLDCCKLYIAPETASCGHTSCHACWRKRRSCVCCAAPLDRRTLKLNIPIQIITEHAHYMCDLFEKTFKFKVDTFSIGDGLSGQLESEPDPTKNVDYWLTSSQNHFSAPVSSDCTQDITTVEHLTSTVQVHSHTKKVLSPKKVVHKQPVQDDWEKIEQFPDTGELNVKENKIINNKKEYSTENPRRSLRKKEPKHNEHFANSVDASKDNSSSKNSSNDSENKTVKTCIETESKAVKTKQKWNNVKKMRKEFSKLNKQNRNKLNVSIEMCKKTKANSSKQNNFNEIDTNSVQLIIEESTPGDEIKNNPQTKKDETQTNNTGDHSIKNYGSKNEDLHERNLNAPNRVPNNTNPNADRSKTNNIDIQNENISSKCNNDHDGRNENITKMPFYKKGVLHNEVESNLKTVNYNIDCSNNENIDDVEITIKIGDTVANIFIKRRKNDPPKVNVNQEIQTSIGVHTLDTKSQHNMHNLKNIEENTDNGQSIAVGLVNQEPASINNIAPIESANINKSVFSKSNTDKIVPVRLGMVNTTMSTKKNTASAETVTAQFELTDSVEKELCVMEIDEHVASDKQNSKILLTQKSNLKNVLPSNTPSKNEMKIPVQECEATEYLNDLDIFDSGSVQEANVHVLKNVHNTPSAIFIPTMKSIKATQKKAEKRTRETSEDIELINKKQKVIQDSPKMNDTVESIKSLQKEFIQDSEGINYDAIMGQVFANIDADIHNSQKNKSILKESQTVEETHKHMLDQQKTVVLVPEKTTEMPINIEDSIDDNSNAPGRYSENIFTIIDKENDNSEIIEDRVQNENPNAIQQQVIAEHLTPEVIMGDGDKLCTPHIEDDDKSVVEETPQKSVSFTKPKSVQQSVSLLKEKTMDESQLLCSILGVSDTDTSSKVSKDITIVDNVRKQTETPLTINKFVDQIKHKSTPVARKSLNFENYEDDPEQTLCPTTEVAKTTQEKEFMSKAFESTPTSPLRRPLMVRNAKLDVKPYCIAGSCLTSMELMKVKMLCRQNNWKYVDKYTDELTHLVVGVDDENKSQRSVKYMCALAASKWIVSFRWIDVCLSTNKIVNEEFFEALDGTGEPGPKRSRIAKKKLFEGITFYCMPPFSVLDVDTLKSMVLAAGGAVVEEARGARAGARPALLLAEPEDTQENKFMYMAIELSIVPVNYEWVLNCLGSYSLCSVRELLLCPASLLPAAAARWPQSLLSSDE